MSVWSKLSPKMIFHSVEFPRGKMVGLIINSSRNMSKTDIIDLHDQVLNVTKQGNDVPRYLVYISDKIAAS